MTIAARSAKLVTALSVGYMIMLGLVTVWTVGIDETVAIHYGPTLQPNYGLPALLAVAMMPILSLVFVRWLARPSPQTGLVEAERATSFAITLGVTLFVQSFICLMAILA